MGAAAFSTRYMVLGAVSMVWIGGKGKRGNHTLTSKPPIRTTDQREADLSREFLPGLIGGHCLFCGLPKGARVANLEHVLVCLRLHVWHVLGALCFRSHSTMS